MKIIELIQSPSTDPYMNLGVEEYLMETCPPDTLRFYLWQNAHTVVIGKNQHAPSEVHLQRLIDDNGKLARRSSGGGAVYHDLGNLNFTFIAPMNIYNLTKQMESLCLTLRSFNLPAVLSGRNDIEIDGAKVSGNAFLKRNNIGLHHGTLLIAVEKENLGKYLNVSAAKLERKNVKSVKARIANLADLNPAITIEAIKIKLIETVAELYQCPVNEIPFPNQEAATSIRKFASQEWLALTESNGILKIDHRFAFGSIRWLLEVRSNRIIGSHLYSDALDVAWIELLQDSVIGIPDTTESLTSRLMELKFEINLQNQLDEIIEWLQAAKEGNLCEK